MAESTFTYTAVKKKKTKKKRCRGTPSIERSQLMWSRGFETRRQANYVCFLWSKFPGYISKSVVIKSSNLLRTVKVIIPEAGWCSIKITHAVCSLGSTVKYGAVKINPATSPWQQELLTSLQGHGSDMLMLFPTCVRVCECVFLCVARVYECQGFGG